MEHLLIKAATTAATDQGTFEAVISSVSIDREGDIVEPSALVNALQKWVKVGKLVPLAVSHSEHVVGHIDPASAQVVGAEVVVKGWIDQSTELGKEMWRLVKSGTLSFSYGFMVPEGGATKRQGATRGSHITEMDLFEVSVVPIAPANNDTRVLAFKAMSMGMMAERMRAMAAEMEAENPPDPQAMAQRMRAMAEQMAGMGKSAGEALTKDSSENVDGTDGVTDEKSVETDAQEPSEQAHRSDPLRKRADAIALEFATGGVNPKPPRQVEQPKPEPELSLQELKQRTRDEILMHLSGETF